MRDIIFHIGLHKTGTTTLQQQFFPACTGLNLVIGHNPRARIFTRYVTRTDPIYFDPAQARSLLDPHLSANEINLVSSETFSWVSWAGVMIPGLDNRSATIENLKCAYPEAKIILTLRRQDSLVRALYRQYLQAGGTKKPDGVFLGTSDGMPPIVPHDYFRFKPYVDTLNTAFPSRLLILTFEEFLENQASFLEKLCAHVEVGCPAINLSKVNATRMGSTGLELTRRINKLFRSHLNPGGLLPGYPVRTRGKWRFRSPSYWLHDHWPLRGSIPKEHRIHQIGQEVLDRVREDNRLLDQHYQLDLNNYGYL